LVASQPIEELVEVVLPLIEWPIVSDELGKGVSVLQHHVGSPMNMFDELSVRWPES